jgi:zinc/manganese transport system substrate-binding protein
MRNLKLLLVFLLALPAGAFAQGKLNVVTTTEDLASIAREIGGDRATVESIARGYQDPHFVEAKPSFIL